jgi:hypothetical protein
MDAKLPATCQQQVSRNRVKSFLKIYEHNIQLLTLVAGPVNEII